MNPVMFWTKTSSARERPEQKRERELGENGKEIEES